MEEQATYRETPTVGKIAAALAKAQATITSPPRNREVEVISKRTNSKYKFKYATLDSIIDHVRGPLTENGLWFVQVLEGADSGKYRLVTRLLHESGEQIESRTPLLVDGASNQEFGSALTYMRRYALTAILGIAADEDDDANAADGNTVEKSNERSKGAAAGRNVTARRAPKDEPIHDEKVRAFLARENPQFSDKVNDGDFCMKMREAAHLAPDIPTLDKLVNANRKRIEALDGGNTEALRSTIENAREQITNMESIAA